MKWTPEKPRQSRSHSHPSIPDSQSWSATPPPGAVDPVPSVGEYSHGVCLFDGLELQPPGLGYLDRSREEVEPVLCMAPK